MIRTDGYARSVPKLSDAEVAPLGSSSDVNVNYKGKEGNELKPMINAKPTVMYQEVETRKRIQSKAVKKERDVDKAKSPPKWTTNGDNGWNLESSRQNDEISDSIDAKKLGTYGRLKSEMTECLDEFEGAAPCKPDPLPKANKSASRKEGEEAKSSKVEEQTRPTILKRMSNDEDAQTDNFYDLYEEVGIEEEKVVTNKSSNSQTVLGIETILRLLRRSTIGLRSNRSARISASAKAQRNKSSKCKHKNASTPGISREAPQHGEDTTKVSAHNEVKSESEWDANAEYEYDEMIEYEQQLTKGCPNGMESDVNDDLYDDIIPKDDSQAMESKVHKPMPKMSGSKSKFIGNKPSSLNNSKNTKDSKLLNAGKDCRKQSSEALGDGVSGEGDSGEIYMNAELFRRLPDAVKDDSPPPIPPKMSQINQAYDKGKKNNRKAQAPEISKEQRSGTFDSLKRQLSRNRTILPTKKRNARGKQVTRMLGLCPVKSKRGKKPVPPKEVNKPPTNAEPYVERLPNGEIVTGIPDEGEGEYEEYCYASELVDHSEIDQQAHQDKTFPSKERPSVAEPKKFEKNSDMLSTVESNVNEDYYEDPEIPPSQIPTYRQEKPMDGRKDVLESQIKGGKMPKALEPKRYEDVQVLSDRRLPAPPIPASEPAAGIKPKAPKPIDSPVIRANRSFPQIKQQREEQVPKKPPKDNPPVSRTTSPEKQPLKSEIAHFNDGTKEDLLTLPSEAKANPDTSPDDLKSTSQPKTIPKIPPRPQHIPQSLLLKIVNSTEVNEVQQRPPTPEVTEQQTNEEGEQMNKEQEQTNSGLVEAEKPSENEPTTMENQDSTPSDETTLTLECENDLYMHLEDCY